MTAKMLLEQYMAERHALGFVSKTDEGCIRRFLRDYKEPEDGKIVFSKEYVLEHIGTGLNQKANTVLRDVSAINGFLNFVIRKGFTAYKIRPSLCPKKCAISGPIYLLTLKLKRCWILQTIFLYARKTR